MFLSFWNKNYSHDPAFHKQTSVLGNPIFLTSKTLGHKLYIFDKYNNNWCINKDLKPINTQAIHQHRTWLLQHCKTEYNIGLFKMFSRWILHIFKVQIQSERGHKLIQFMFQNKDKDLLGIYQYGCDPFCVSLLTERHLKVHCDTDFVLHFQTKALLCLRVTRSITRCTQKVKSWHATLRLQISTFWAW